MSAINSNGSNLRVEHNLDGKTVSSEELNNSFYDRNQQREQTYRELAEDEPHPFLRNRGKALPDLNQAKEAKKAAPKAKEDPKITSANNKDLKNKRLK